MDYALRGGQLPHEAALLKLGEELVGHAQRGFVNAARKCATYPVEELLKPKVLDEVQSCELGVKELHEFLAVALVDDKVCVQLARSQQAEVMVRQDRFAAEAHRGILGDDEHAHGFHRYARAPKSR